MENNIDSALQKVVFTFSIPQCPHCKKPTKRTGGSHTVTTAYYPPVYDDKGINQNRARAAARSKWECHMCNKSYSVTGSQNDGYYYSEI